MSRIAAARGAVKAEGKKVFSEVVNKWAINILGVGCGDTVDLAHQGREPVTKVKTSVSLKL